MPISADRILAVKLVTDVSSMAQDMKKTERGVKRLSGKVRGLAKGAASWGKAFAGAAIISGAEAVAGAIGDAIEGAQEGRRQLRSLEDTARRLGLPLEQVAKGFDAVSESARQAGVDDTPVQQLFNTLIARGDATWKATRKVNAALDVSAKLGIPVSKASKLIEAAMDGSASAAAKLGIKGGKGVTVLKQLERRFGGAAEAAADADPMKKALNDIGESLETIADVALVPALEAFGGIMSTVVAPGIRDVSEALAGVDWGSIDWSQALQDALQAALDTVVAAVNGDQLNSVQQLGIAVAGGVFAIGLFVKAARTMWALPGWSAKWIVRAGAKAMGLAFGAAMFVAEVFVGFASRALAAVGVSRDALSTARAAGTMIGVQVLSGIAAGLTGAALVKAVADELFRRAPQVNIGGIDSPNPANGRQLPKDPIRALFEAFGIHYGLGTPGASRGWHVVGDQGPELVRFRGGEQVLSNRASMAAMGSGGSTINVSITAGVGDPVSIGREVDRVLRQYRRVAGLPA